MEHLFLEFIGTPRNLMILIVDDNIDSCEALASFLAWDNHYARSIHSGKAALEWLAIHLPDVVVLDDYMPGMDGLDLMRELRKDERYATLPVIFYSAGEDPERRTIAMGLGAAGWIAKGRMSWKDVAEKIVSLLPPVTTSLAEVPPVSGRDSAGSFKRA
jgi:CheY-like chemotaxis protein